MIALSTPVLVLATWAALIVVVALLVAVVGAIETRRYVSKLSPDAKRLLAVRQSEMTRRQRQIAS